MTNFGKCETCRTRKVKCDEQVPTCLACRKKGRRCHYANSRSSIFVFEQVELVHRGSVEYDTSTGTSKSSITFTATETPAEPQSDASKQAKISLKQFHKAANGYGGRFTHERQTITKALVNKGHHRTGQSSRWVSYYPTDLQARSYSPKPALLCPQAKVSVTWAKIFGYEALELNPLGGWIKTAWLWAGGDTNIDLALGYVLKSMRAFQSRDEESRVRACAAGEKALLSVQTALSSRKGQERIENLVLAVMLHCAAEQFIDIGSWYYIPHVLGLSELLRSYLQDGPCSDVIRNVVSLICIDEVNVSIFWGRHSSLENISRPCTPVDGPYELDVAISAVDYLLVKLPGLVCLVRSVVESDDNDYNKSEATRVIDELYCSTLDKYCKETLAIHASTVPCFGETARSPAGSMLAFDDLRAFVLATRYYLYRVLLCGLMQTLKRVDPDSLCCDVKIVEQEDIKAAMSLAMCQDYALKPATYRPLTALGMLIPLQLGSGAWDRLQARQQSCEALEYQYAVRMKEWSLENIHYLEALWSGRHTNRERMEAVCQMFAGGALLDNVYDYKRVESLQHIESNATNNLQLQELCWQPSGPT